MLPWILFEFFHTSAVICKQRFLHKNQIAQYLQTTNTKTLIKVILESSQKLLQIPSETSALRQPIQFFTGRSILSYFLRLSCYNFHIALTKSIKLNFFKKIALQPLKTGQNSDSYGNPARNNGSLKYFRKYFFCSVFFNIT